MSFVFESVERFIAGTVGEPGERAFFIQARNGGRLVTVALEKAQVAALTERLEIVIKDLSKNGFSLVIERMPRDNAALELPIDAEFDVGAISMAWDEEAKSMSIELFEMQSDQSQAENSLTVSINLGMCAGFVQRCKALLRAGRLPCPFCGMPIDPQSHLCPRANGYRR